MAFRIFRPLLRPLASTATVAGIFAFTACAGGGHPALNADAQTPPTNAPQKNATTPANATAQAREGANATAQSRETAATQTDHMMMKPTVESARTQLGGWKDAARKTGMSMLDKYGAPNEMTETRMVWIGNGPWEWSILTNDPTQHDFPGPHLDVLEQAINYKAPLDMYDDLAKYDGSVVLNRTQGQMSARCDMEGANFLALNLANDVATKVKTVDQAREYYAMAIKKSKSDNVMDPYMKSLAFDVMSASAGDADMTIIKN